MNAESRVARWRRVLTRIAVIALPAGLSVAVVTPRVAPAQILQVPTPFGDVSFDTDEFFADHFDGSDASGDEFDLNAPINIVQGGIGSTQDVRNFLEDF